MRLAHVTVRGYIIHRERLAPREAVAQKRAVKRDATAHICRHYITGGEEETHLPPARARFSAGGKLRRRVDASRP